MTKIKQMVLTMYSMSCWARGPSAFVIALSTLLQMNTLHANPTSRSFSEKTHTIQSLSMMPDAQLFELIRNEGIVLDCIPQGTSAGKPGRINKEAIQRENTTKSIFRYLFDFLGNNNSQLAAGLIWKGKTFTRSPDNCSHGTGVNKVGLFNLFTLNTRTIAKESFLDDALRLRDANEIDFENALIANKNPIKLVELNYAKAGRDPLNAGKNFGVRDIMIPIQGKYGPIYIGRAYTGKWDSETQFTSTGLVAWFFLDFSAEAVSENKQWGFWF